MNQATKLIRERNFSLKGGDEYINDQRKLGWQCHLCYASGLMGTNQCGQNHIHDQLHILILFRSTYVKHVINLYMNYWTLYTNEITYFYIYTLMYILEFIS